MDNTMIAILVAAVAVILLGLAIGMMMANRNKSKKLQDQFGTEYNRTVAETGDRKRAESELQHRQERVQALNLRPLSAAELDRFSRDWNDVQTRFVDSPEGAVSEADRLVQEVMAARGYPTTGFEQQAADISVDHPEFVRNYRAAHQVGMLVGEGRANTEEMRNGFVSYRALFAELLADGSTVAPDSRNEPVVRERDPQPIRPAQRRL